jgi:Na+/H+-dicarboxylate symporter
VRIEMMRFITKLLSNPLFILATLGASILFGVKFPDISRSLDPIGGYYISFLKMIVLPYLLTTITIGIASVAADPKGARYTWRIVVIYPLSMILVAALSVGACFLLPPAGNTSDGEAMAALGAIVNKESHGDQSANRLEVTLSKPKVVETQIATYPIIDRFVPSNVFESLTQGDSLKVVIFCIIFGAALARQEGAGSFSLLANMKIVQSACIEVIRWLNLLLPITLFAMVSGQVSKVGAGPLLSLAPFVTVQVLTACVLILISALIIARSAHVSPIDAFVKLRETLILAVTTRSSFACIPVAARELVEKLHFNRFGTELVMPLGTTICRIGHVQYFVIGTIFVSQMYGVDLTLAHYALIIITSVAAGFASSGASGALGVVMISIVTDALHLPVEAAIALFIAVDPIIDVFRTTVLVYGNCALTAIMTPLEKDPALWTSEAPEARAA